MGRSLRPFSTLGRMVPPMSDPASGIEWFIAVSTGASALATATAAAVVARQTFWTRRAVEVAEGGTKLSQTMAVEATKTRLDLRAVHIIVQSQGEVEWPPLEPSDFGQPQPVQVGRTYHLPGDGNERLLLRVPILIYNHSDHRVALMISGMVPQDWIPSQRVPETLVVDPEEYAVYFFQVSRSVAEWAEGYRNAPDVGVPEAHGTVGYSDPYDDGVIDEWTLVLAGRPVVPVPNKDGLWQIATEQRLDIPSMPSAVGLVRPMTRRYFASKINNVTL